MSAAAAFLLGALVVGAVWVLRWVDDDIILGAAIFGALAGALGLAIIGGALWALW